jgi:hypothetical protein
VWELNCRGYEKVIVADFLDASKWLNLACLENTWKSYAALSARPLRMRIEHSMPRLAGARGSDCSADAWGPHRGSGRFPAADAFGQL